MCASFTDGRPTTGGSAPTSSPRSAGRCRGNSAATAAAAAPRPRYATRSATPSTGARCASDDDALQEPGSPGDNVISVRLPREDSMMRDHADQWINRSEGAVQFYSGI